MILFGCNETANPLHNPATGHYSHVSVARPLSLVDWKLLEFVQNNISATNIRGDILDALVVSSDHFHQEINIDKEFKDKRIIIMTDFSNSTDADGNIDKIARSLSKHSIRVDVISPFTDDDDDGDQENEPRTSATVILSIYYYNNKFIARTLTRCKRFQT